MVIFLAWQPLQWSYLKSLNIDMKLFYSDLNTIAGLHSWAPTASRSYSQRWISGVCEALWITLLKFALQINLSCLAYEEAAWLQSVCCAEEKRGEGVVFYLKNAQRLKRPSLSVSCPACLPFSHLAWFMGLSVATIRTLEVGLHHTVDGMHSQILGWTQSQTLMGAQNDLL